MWLTLARVFVRALAGILTGVTNSVPEEAGVREAAVVASVRRGVTFEPVHAVTVSPVKATNTNLKNT